MSTSQHTTKEGNPDMRFKENQQGESSQKGGQSKSNENISGSQGSQGGSQGGSHMTKEGNPDMRFKENQEGEPYQKEAGQKGGQARSDESGSRSQGGQQSQSGRGSEHLTKEGEPDMRFKENKEVTGES